MHGLARTYPPPARAIVAGCLFALLATTFAQAYIPGTQVWVRRYPTTRTDGGSKNAADAAGNIYVAGNSVGASTGSDFLTLKYSPSGRLLWARRYAGAGKTAEEARGLAVTPTGIVYVTGVRGPDQGPSDCILLSYTTGGRLRWAESYRSRPADICGGEAVTVDASGNPVVVGGTASPPLPGPRILTIKYDSAGNRKWLATYGSEGEGGSDASVDASGNIYVAGASGGVDMSYFTTISYSPSGIRRWVNRFAVGTGGTNGDVALNIAEAIAVDGGHVYVAGQGMPSGPNDSDLITMKLDTAGNRDWVRRYDDPHRGDEVGWDVAVKNGNVYVAGATWVYGTWQADSVVVKYDTAGARQWVSRYGGPAAGGNDTLTCLAVNDSEAVYATGRSDGGSGAGSDFVTMKIRASGPRQWVRRYNGPAKSTDEAWALVLSQGSVYVTGNSRGPSTGPDVCTIKYAQ